jgi:Sigma-70, region 4
MPGGDATSEGPSCTPRHLGNGEGKDLKAVLHEEVDRLPAKYRQPLVLCYFDGQTHDQAAARLAWPIGTVRTRLRRGRDLLHSRLVQRGVTLSAGAFTALLSQAEASASVPTGLTATTRRLSGSAFASHHQHQLRLQGRRVCSQRGAIRASGSGPPLRLRLAGCPRPAGLPAHAGRCRSLQTPLVSSWTRAIWTAGPGNLVLRTCWPGRGKKAT